MKTFSKSKLIIIALLGSFSMALTSCEKNILRPAQAVEDQKRALAAGDAPNAELLYALDLQLCDDGAKVTAIEAAPGKYVIVRQCGDKSSITKGGRCDCPVCCRVEPGTPSLPGTTRILEPKLRGVLDAVIVTTFTQGAIDSLKKVAISRISFEISPKASAWLNKNGGRYVGLYPGRNKHNECETLIAGFDAKGNAIDGGDIYAVAQHCPAMK